MVASKPKTVKVKNHIQQDNALSKSARQTKRTLVLKTLRLSTKQVKNVNPKDKKDITRYNTRTETRIFTT